MRTLYIQCEMGAAGDMLMAALLELYDDPQGFLEKINSCGLHGVRVSREDRMRCGVGGTGINVTYHGHSEDGHSHTHQHHSHGHGMEDIKRIASKLSVSEKVREDLLAVYTLIAEAEAEIHKKSMDNIHFHELGTMDALADILGVCILMEELDPGRVVVSPVNTGSGTVRCAHGVLPVPAPATAKLLLGIPSYSGGIQSELCTPTGAALLRHFADEFGQLPRMVTEKIGYGMGNKDFEEASNCVRVFLGNAEIKGGSPNDEVCVLSCNIDDMTGEALSFASQALMESGALDVTLIPVMMKKGRPGHIMQLMCRPAEADDIAGLIFKYTSTIGIRRAEYPRYALESRFEDRDGIRYKVSEGYGVIREKAEYEDKAKLSRDKGTGYF